MIVASPFDASAPVVGTLAAGTGILGTDSGVFAGTGTAPTTGIMPGGGITPKPGGTSFTPSAPDAGTTTKPPSETGTKVETVTTTDDAAKKDTTGGAATEEKTTLAAVTDRIKDMPTWVKPVAITALVLLALFAAYKLWFTANAAA